MKATVADTEGEVAKFKAAVTQTAKDLEMIKAVAAKNLSEEEAAVFDAHALMLGDPEFQGQIEASIKEGLNGGASIEKVAANMSAMFEMIPDAYFQERAADVRDVSRRLLANFLGKPLPNPALIDEEVVIIAEDLTPSDTAQLNKNLVKGFATNIGGRTSHSAIMARSLEIPAVVSCKTITEDVNDGDMIVLDGSEGVVLINPEEATVKEYEGKRAAFIAYREELKKLVNEKTVTTDGHHVELVANIGGAGDLPGAHENGAEGVGLFRTEFLYMESAELPSEERQFEVYKEVLESMAGKPVVVRTLDIGGDKKIEAIDLPDEMNPFLGVRAVRLCFQREDIFRTQLRALLRASVYGKLRIMFPMIATV
ncbi:MAG: phosphoenolpyruvate--protein phosphotransferase, partial [Erysipelotrichaceae bacterium]|nr:phosphoenolpyruvate--protein phosphotransferase [Erysipelotrichaceae bacterium]